MSGRPFMCPVVGAYRIRPLPGQGSLPDTRPFMYQEKFAGVRRRPRNDERASPNRWGCPFLYPVVGAYRIRPPTRTRKGPNDQTPRVHVIRFTCARLFCVRISAFIPAGCLGGVFDTPLPGYTPLHVPGPSCIRPNLAGIPDAPFCFAF